MRKIFKGLLKGLTVIVLTGVFLFVFLILALKGQQVFHAWQKYVHMRMINKNFSTSEAFQKYFDVLSSQYDKDWALASAAVLCKPEFVKYATAHGARNQTEIEIVTNFHWADTTDRWVFINREPWEQYRRGIQFLGDVAHYLPYQTPQSFQLDCMCISSSQSLGIFTVSQLLEECQKH